MKKTSYILPGVDLLDKDPMITAEQHEFVKKKGETISQMINDAGIECSYITSYISESAISYQMRIKFNEDYARIFSGKESIRKAGIHNDLFILVPFSEKAVSLYSTLYGLNAGEHNNQELTYSLGIDFLARKQYGSLNKNGNLMIVGSTMSGKTSFVKALLISLVMTLSPDDLKLIVIDSKLLNYSEFNDSPYLLSPVINNSPEMITNTLRSINTIIKDRINVIVKAGCKSAEAYNRRTGNSDRLTLPFIVVVIDQIDDILSESPDSYQIIQSVIGNANIAGVHLVCTCRETNQRLINKIISNRSWGHIVLDNNSASNSSNVVGKMIDEDLSYIGDAIYKENAFSDFKRIVLVQVTDEEIGRVNNFSSAQKRPSFDEMFTRLDNLDVSVTDSMIDDNDPMLEEVIQFVIDQQRVSASLLQRHFGIGYNRAARLINVLEEEGVISPANGSILREVYVKRR